MLEKALIMIAVVNFSIAAMYPLVELWRYKIVDDISSFLEDFRGRGIMPPREESRLIWWCDRVFKARWLINTARIFPVVIVPLWEFDWLILRMYYTKKFLTKPSAA